MRIERLRRQTHVRRNWPAFWVLLPLLTVILYFLAISTNQLCLWLLLAVWVHWCLRR